MKVFGLVLLLIAVVSNSAAAQDIPAGVDQTFSIESMNPSLTFSMADAVVRLDNQQFEVKKRGKAVWRTHRAVTIFNKEGRDYGIVGYPYDKFRKPKKLEAQIRDANGKVVRKLKKGDIEDYSAISDFSLYEDSRIRVARLEHGVYPYTIEYWYEIEYDGYISWPSWEPESMGLSVEHARFEVQVPADMNVRYRLEGDNMEPLLIPGGKNKVYRWEVTALRKQTTNLLAALSVEFIPDAQTMSVTLAPEDFEIEGSVGDMRTWASFGAWYYNLNRGRDVLPVEKADEVRRTLQGVTDPKEKARKVYDLFQSSTRYVSVQLGIGGWQTYDASYVAERGYGDCKALSNYLKAMLKVAGIESYPTLIHSNRWGSDVEESFPNNEFNHVILMVPLPADTLWLEATSQVIPFGRIGASNEDRYALAVSQAGGVLVRTPASMAAQNAKIRTAEVKVEPSGSASATLEMSYKGNQQDRITHTLVNASHRDQLAWFHNALEIPSFDVVNVDFSQVQSSVPESRIVANLKLPRYASQTGSRLFLPTNMLERQSFDLPPEDSPEPVTLPYVFLDEDVVIYHLPAGYQIEAMPEDVFLETSFANFSVTHALENGLLTYRRVLEFTDRDIDIELYDDFREFLVQMAKANRSQVVLVKG
ncbi:MAG: DUF3857 domain-containing protein [Rhodothermales bacterium]